MDVSNACRVEDRGIWAKAHYEGCEKWLFIMEGSLLTNFKAARLREMRVLITGLHLFYITELLKSSRVISIGSPSFDNPLCL